MVESKSLPYKLINLDLNKKGNLLPIESSNVGCGAKSVLRIMTATEKRLEHLFRINAQTLLICLVQKMFESTNSHLQYLFFHQQKKIIKSKVLTCLCCPYTIMQKNITMQTFWLKLRNWVSMMTEQMYFSLGFLILVIW